MTLRRAAPALVGLLFLALFFAATFDPRVQLYYRDTGRLYYPVKLYIARHLRAGSLPLWDTMVESGVSLLGQVTPGLLHPATLLYLVFPFDLAFKLNHVLGPLLGGIGAWLLARRLGTGAWAALAAAIAYGGCGYVISMTGSNLPYALGAGTVPIAIDAALRFVERPAAGRLAWAGAAFASIACAGEPQATVIAGLLTAAWAALEGGNLRRAARNLGLVAACGAIALCLAAPAVLTGWFQLRRSSRAHGLSQHDLTWFANHPLRLAGLVVPRAFDDVSAQSTEPGEWIETYPEYFGTPNSAFSDSIVLGAPAILFAVAALWTGRKARLLFAGGALFALASTGGALGIDRLLFAAVPLASIFRFAEKLIGPASLLFALAAAVGAESTLAGTRRAAGRLAMGAAAFAAVAWIASVIFGAHVAGAAETIVPYGRTHSHPVARWFVEQLRVGLLDAAALSAAVAAAAAWRAARGRPSIGLAPICCAASVFASCGGLLYTAPVEYLHGPFDLAERLEAIAGPSPGSWRIFTQFTNAPGFRGIDARVQTVLGLSQALMPQYNSVARIESTATYFSVGEPNYLRAFGELPERYFSLFDVRFAIEMPIAFNERTARERGFRKIGFGYWVREYPGGPRAFVAGDARRIESFEEGLRRLGDDSFHLRSEALIRGEDAPERVVGGSTPARLERLSAERMRVHAQGPGLLVVGEHYDPGWRARVNGAPAAVVETDLAAIGVVLPPGPTTVDLRFIPQGLIPGLILFVLAAAGLIYAGVRRYPPLDAE